MWIGPGLLGNNLALVDRIVPIPGSHGIVTIKETVLGK